MFFNFTNITEINLSYFDISKVIKMNRMFYNCTSLTSLDLSNFNTLKVTTMSSMFTYCSSLTSLDLSNFDTSNVNDMDYMFYECINLEYINLYNFKESKLDDLKEIFTGVPVNIVICINNDNPEEKIISEIQYLDCYAINCSNDWKSKQKKFFNEIIMLIMIVIKVVKSQ